MTRTLTIIAFAAAAALAGCNKEDQTIVAGGPADPMANELGNASAIQLPPAITASKIYRCKDNSLVYIDWLSDGSARVKKDRTEIGTQVQPGQTGEPGSPSLAGGPTDTTVTYNGQSCKG